MFVACASGKHFSEAVLSVRKPGSDRDFLVITMQDVVITSYEVGSDGTLPTESVSRAFERIIFTYVPQNPDGSFGDPVEAGWNFRENRPV